MSDSTGTKPPREQQKRNYKPTLNLPKTPFAMKANLVQREPRFQKRWLDLDLYARLRRSADGRPRFVLHDGPPYANGDIHLGHLLNKVMKDMVVRSRNMLGYDAPFVPGWDCHGLPIEQKVLQALGETARTLSAQQIRHRCQKYAEKYVKIQSRQMQRLGTLGDYADPYKTMQPRYEAAVLEVFAALVEKGLVQRALRPVHWSVANRTALADAELEHLDREDTSVFVLFEVEDPSVLPASLGGDPGVGTHLMIWTTTPWTLPANLAVAVLPDAEYGLYRIEHEGKPCAVIVAVELAERVLARSGLGGQRLGTARGSELAASVLRYRHPFVDRVAPVVTADYVTTEDGSGLVHTAPGHGADDFDTGKRHGLEIYCPVRGDGTFDDTVPDWLRGKDVWEGNAIIVERLERNGRLFHREKFKHSYPHDWRSKTPTIFRATEQWFVRVDHGMESLRELAMRVTGSDVRFYPESGRNRMRGMLESRPDWCISRQRSWGLPIPAFFGRQPGQVLLTPASVRAVAEQFRQRGSNCWFDGSPVELLAAYDPAADPEAPSWLAGSTDVVEKLEAGRDIFDVWFESGSSWHAVARLRELGYPVDLYLEGSDQHRGWFQLSLLTALGATGQSPFKGVLTHGFMVDREGKKFAKSAGNAIAVEDLLQRFGADVCRWWISSLNTDNDIKADLELLQLAGEEYRKVRNTIRFLLSNLGDFDPTRDRRDLGEADRASLDGWAAAELAGLVAQVRLAFEGHRFRQVHDAVFEFCNETLSAVYLAGVKDRLYCDRVDSDRRRRTQTVLHDIARALIHLTAPILVHTAEEAFLALRGEEPDHPATEDSVHANLLPEAVAFEADSAWPEVMHLRDRVLKALEEARDRGDIVNPLDAGVSLGLPEHGRERFRPFVTDLADLCGVSRLRLVAADQIAVTIDDLGDEPRCERSWKRDGTVKQRSDGGWLTDRDAAAVGVT